MSEATVYPRIWDLDGERKIIGETRLSWLVDSGLRRRPSIKVSKKAPNKKDYCPTWFLLESEREDRLYVLEHSSAIANKLYRSYPGELTADQLRQIAAIIGYEVKR